VALLVVALAACGGNNGGSDDSTRILLEPETVPLPSGTAERVRFAAADGVTLAGTIFGEGETAVVLSHMGRGGDTQEDWYRVADLLARRGFLALTYNRRGVCPSGAGADDCSEGTDDLATSWKDVVGAAAYVQTRGAQRVLLVGASIGAMSSLFAAASGQVEPAGVVEIGGINDESGYHFTPAQIERIRGPKLFVSSRGDIYDGAAAARQWYRWARPPKQLTLLPGDLHGTDILAEGDANARRLERLLLEFVAEAGR
jgi:pimeloyl-ACP methyl ester carboxylesterase